jgi:hypothetical protein
MAILMLVLIPTFLYVLTADDLLRYRLNLQEVVVASPWDYTHLNYEPGGVAGNALVPHLQRTYADINLAYSSNAQTGDKEGIATMTSSGWGKEGSAKVVCSKEGIASELALSLSAQTLKQQVDHGGLYICNAALGVENVRLVKRFLQEFAGDVEVSEKAKGEAWGLNRQYFSVVADTWAMTRVENVEPNASGRGKVLQSRVNSVYSIPSLPAVAKAVQYVNSASQILSPIVFVDDRTDMGLGDDTATAEVGFSTSSSRPQTSGNSGFDASPWRHKGARGDDTYQQVYNRRANTYMGRPLQ